MIRFGSLQQFLIEKNGQKSPKNQIGSLKQNEISQKKKKKIKDKNESIGKGNKCMYHCAMFGYQEHIVFFFFGNSLMDVSVFYRTEAPFDFK